MKVIITGTTGYVGEGVMLACLDNPEIEKVLSVSRRPCGHSHPKLEEYIVPDFMALEAGDPKLQGYDAVFFIAGISSVGLKEEQYVGISHNIPLHFANVDRAAKESGHIALVSAGWDPGLFSVNRLYASAVLPRWQTYSFWGKGVSQGHSDAVRRIPGVIDCRQYTIPVEDALERVRRGENPQLTTRQKHTRECFVVAKEGADLDRIEKEIKEKTNTRLIVESVKNIIQESN